MHRSLRAVIIFFNCKTQILIKKKNHRLKIKNAFVIFLVNNMNWCMYANEYIFMLLKLLKIMTNCEQSFKNVMRKKY